MIDVQNRRAKENYDDAYKIPNDYSGYMIFKHGIKQYTGDANRYGNQKTSYMAGCVKTSGSMS